MCAMLVSPAIVSITGARCVGSPCRRAALHAAVLVPEMNLQVVDLLSQAHETKRARFDDSRVDRTHGNLVHLFALDPVERVGGHVGLSSAFVADRLEPRMAGDADTCLFVHLSFEGVKRGKARRELVETHIDGRRGARDFDVTRRDPEHGGDQDPIALGSTKEREQPGTPFQSMEDVLPPCGDVLPRQCFQRNLVDEQRSHEPSSEIATCWMCRLTAAGCRCRGRGG